MTLCIPRSAAVQSEHHNMLQNYLPFPPIGMTWQIAIKFVLWRNKGVIGWLHIAIADRRPTLRPTLFLRR